MTIFEQVKECVTARQAAEHYGIKVKGNGMACCPFHKDRHPSMKAMAVRRFVWLWKEMVQRFSDNRWL